MAARLAVSENTLEKHVGAILRETKLGSRKALLAFVLPHHLDALASPPEGAAPACEEEETHVFAAERGMWQGLPAPEAGVMASASLKNT